jgi:CheY-like chemotaxis protein
MPDPAYSTSHASEVWQLLLVADDVELCGLLQGVLVGQGFQMSLAHDGPSGLVRALGEPYDLVLIDIMLPGDERPRSVAAASAPHDGADHHAHSEG